MQMVINAEKNHNQR